MDTALLNSRRLVQPEGGSLNTTRLTPDEFVKSYAGSLPRGSEKLLLEYQYLSNLPDDIAAHFPRVKGFQHDPAKPYTELRLQRIKHPAFAKAILRRVITPARTNELLSAILSFLTERLYPLRGGDMAGVTLYRQFHGDRIERSLFLLREQPDIRDLVIAPEVLVNGIACPSAESTCKWLHEHAADIFQSSHWLVAGHGDTHLDNMMVTTNGSPDFFLIDPRGDPLLPPHYDLAKLLKALRTGYDLVHYDSYAIDMQIAPSGPRVSLRVDNSFREYYHAGMEALLRALPDFARAERVSELAFTRALVIAELAHVISFASYHANRPEGCDTGRVSAYLATAALLARDLMTEAPDIARPLPIWSPKDC